MLYFSKVHITLFYYISVKSILCALNVAQRRAVLRVLMSKDYVLIKGYPGTGQWGSAGVSKVHRGSVRFSRDQ